MNFSRLAICQITLTIFLAASTAVHAAPASYTLFGSAALTSPGNNSPTAANLSSQGFETLSGVSLSLVEGLTFADYATLKFDYNFLSGTCIGGSPRFQMRLENPDTNEVARFWMFLGDHPNYNSCPSGWQTSPDFLEVGRQIQPANTNTYLEYQNALDQYGSWEVTSLSLVVDGGWAIQPSQLQSVDVDNIVINTSTVTFESANSCKNGGYLSFTSAPGPFVNQGQCVSYFARGGQ